MKRLTTAVACAAVVAGGCSTGRAPQLDRSLPTSAPRTTTTTVPRAASPCPPGQQRAAPPTDRPRYVLHVDVRPGEQDVLGDVAVTFAPDLAIDRLVFRLWPNGPRTAAAGARLDTGPVVVDGATLPSSRQDATTMVVTLPRPRAPGTALTASMPWQLHLAGPIDDRVSHAGDAVRLGSFFPILPWEPGVGWAMDPPTTLDAEASTAPAADFSLTISVPPGLDVLASGVNDAPSHWTAIAARDVALSIGHFRTARAEAHVPGPVAVTVGVDAGVAESPQPYLDKALRAIEQFSARFGPYPWPTYTLAITPGLQGGIEYPSHVMQGPATLTRTTSHEIGHQWFYGLVGNDQGRDPWLDEGLATYAEATFEGTVDRLRGTPVPPAAAGHAGDPVAAYGSKPSTYYAGVYLQTAQALVGLGPQDLVDCALRRYVAVEAYRLARPRDLLAALTSVFPDAAARLAPYGLRG